MSDRIIPAAKLQREQDRIDQDKRRWAELRHISGRRIALNAAPLSAKLYRHGHRDEAIRKFVDAIVKGYVTVEEMATETLIPIAEIEAAVAQRKALV